LFLRRPGERAAIIAHRGASAEAPENTLAAIALAIATGAPMVEVDTCLTADGAMVLIHDDTLERTTSGRGEVRRFHLESLRQLDAGSWFAPRFAGEKIPLLEEALDLVYGKMAINIEIKSSAIEAAPREGSTVGIEARLLEAVKARGMLEQVLFSSFHPLALWRLRRFEPAVRTASLRYLPHHGQREPREILAEVGSSALHVADHEASPELIDLCRRQGIPLRVYTVNDIRRYLELESQGVDAVFTDDPGGLLAPAAKIP